MHRCWMLVAPLFATSPVLLVWMLGACGGAAFTSADASSDASHSEAAVDAARDVTPDAPVASDAAGSKLCTGQSYCPLSNACVSDCLVDCGQGMRTCTWCAFANPSNSGGACVPKSPSGGLSCPTMSGYTPCPCAVSDDCIGTQVCVNHFCRSCGELGTDKQTCGKGGVCDAHMAACVAAVVDAGAD